VEKALDQHSFRKTIIDFIRDKPLGAVAGGVFVLMIVVAILGPLATPQDPGLTDLSRRLGSPSLQHFLGTDYLGRDIFSRLIAGTRLAILVGTVSSLAGATLGSVIGIISGYLGGKTDMFIQRIMDMIMAFPSLILAIAIIAVLGSSVTNVIIAIAFPSIPRANRVARSVAISLREFTFVEAARAVGATSTRIIFFHIMPNAMAAYLILVTSSLGMAILVEASLSFLGLGIPAPHPSWGRSLYDAMPFLYAQPLQAVWPGIAISLAVFASNLFGDALRDKLDPRLKRL